jgi:hypothetical protein
MGLFDDELLPSRATRRRVTTGVSHREVFPPQNNWTMAVQLTRNRLAAMLYWLVHPPSPGRFRNFSGNPVLFCKENLLVLLDGLIRDEESSARRDEYDADRRIRQVRSSVAAMDPYDAAAMKSVCDLVGISVSQIMPKRRRLM